MRYLNPKAKFENMDNEGGIEMEPTPEQIIMQIEELRISIAVKMNEIIVNLKKLELECSQLMDEQQAYDFVQDNPRRPGE